MRQPRVTIEEPAILTIPGAQDKKIMIKDISEEGIRVASDFPLEKGRTYKIFIQNALFREKIAKDFIAVWSNLSNENLWESGLVLEFNEGKNNAQENNDR